MASGLREKGARGVLLVAGLKVIGTLVGRTSQIVLPLYLLPSDFGIFALAVFFFGFLNLASELGMSTDLQRRKVYFEEAAESAFTLRFVLAWVLLGLSLPVGTVVSVLYVDTRLMWPLVVLSVGLLFHAFAMVPRTIASRALDFRRAAIPDSVGKSSGAVVSIGLAILGFAYWSPVYGSLAGAALGAGLQILATRWRPRFAYRRDLAREIIRFGRFVTFASLANFVAHSVDNAIVGLLLGVAPVGFYVFAYSWGVYATSNLTSVFSAVAYPVMSQVSGDRGRFNRVLLENLRYYGYAGFCVSGAVALLAPLMIASIYGSTWGPAALPMQILAPVGLVLGYGGVFADGLYALGRSRTVSRFSWLEVAVVIALVPPATLLGGIAGTSTAALLGATVLTGGLATAAAGATGLRGRDWLASTRHALVAAILAGAVGVIILFVMPPTLLSLGIGAVAYVGLYLIILQILTGGTLLAELRSVVRIALRPAARP